MTSRTQEQILFSKLSEVNEVYCLKSDSFEAYKELVPKELLEYIRLNFNNKKALTRLTAYLYLTMSEEFNQYFIENELSMLKIQDYKGDFLEEETDFINSLIGSLEDDLRAYERGDHSKLTK